MRDGLDARLRQAEDHLKRNRLAEARHRLRGFIATVERESCRTHEDCPADKALAPESLALFKYNTEYLLERL